MPIRIQRKRTKGFRLPAGCVYVGRPSRWGNPFRVKDYSPMPPLHLPSGDIDDDPPTLRAWRMLMHRWSVEDFRAFSIPLWKNEGRDFSALQGKNLTCWCPLWYNDGSRVPCHADVLLEIVNEGYTTPTN